MPWLEGCWREPELSGVLRIRRNGVVTLWQVEDSEKCVPFDRRRNVGLHHLALKVVDRDALDALHARVAAWPDTVIEFAPERSGKGPKAHFMVREPGGTRIEFACVSPAPA